MTGKIIVHVDGGVVQAVYVSKKLENVVCEVWDFDDQAEHPSVVNGRWMKSLEVAARAFAKAIVNTEKVF